MSSLLMSHREKRSSMLRFQTCTVGLKTVLLKLCVSICSHENVGKETAVYAHRGTVFFY